MYIYVGIYNKIIYNIIKYDTAGVAIIAESANGSLGGRLLRLWCGGEAGHVASTIAKHPAWIQYHVLILICYYHNTIIVFTGDLIIS